MSRSYFEASRTWQATYIYYLKKKHDLQLYNNIVTIRSQVTHVGSLDWKKPQVHAKVHLGSYFYFSCINWNYVIYLTYTKREAREVAYPEHYSINLLQGQPSLFAVMAAIFVYPWKSYSKDLQGRKWIFQSESNQHM